MPDPQWQTVRTCTGVTPQGVLPPSSWQVPICPVPPVLSVSDACIVRLCQCLCVLLMLFPLPEMPFHLSLLTGGNKIVADGWYHESFKAVSKGKPRRQHQREGWAPCQAWEGPPGVATLSPQSTSFPSRTWPFLCHGFLLSVHSHPPQEGKSPGWD